MQDGADTLETDLSGLKPAEWKARLAALSEELGQFQPLGERHSAAFIDQGNTLLVTFETLQGIQSLSETAQPLGFDLVRNLGWSHLCVISEGDTWFRDDQIYAFFDQLIDDGFFEEFDRVLFYGAGPCGYAACAYSVAAPGATVIAIQPQATLDPGLTEWDDRFVEMRRTSFSDRYGYAPDMLDAADHAYVFYDPHVRLDAMHAALFARPNVTRRRLPNFGEAIQTRMIEMETLYPLLSMAGSDRLDKLSLSRLLRARRNNPAYLRNVMTNLDKSDRPYLMTLLCRNVSARLRAPRFRHRLQNLRQRAAQGDFTLPPNT